MKLDIKISNKKIFQIIYVVVILINFVSLFFMYSFINEYVYNAFVVDQNYLLSQSHASTNNINMVQFNKVIKNIDQKSEKNNIGSINDIFD